VEGKNTHNVIYHGWVSNDQFNKEIREFQCGLRCNEHDGASEIIFKSLLMGQYPISFLHYDKVWQFKDKETLVELLKKVAEQTEPNMEARDYWLPLFNSYPWMEKGDETYWKERDIDDFLPGLEHRKDLVEEVKKLNPESVLEIGCGCGSNLSIIQKELPNAKIAGIDLSAKSIERAVKNLGNVQLVVGNADNLPFEDKSFDVVITDGTLIYAKSDKIEKIRDEMLRVAKKGIVMAEFHHNSFGKLGKIGLNHWVRNYKELFEGKEVTLKKINNMDSWKWKALAYLITVK
jgi:SAM-dependent methyltransferase